MLLVVGGNLEGPVSKLKLTDRVMLPGVARNISSWYKRADIFALTSATDGFLNVLLEALAHGTRGKHNPKANQPDLASASGGAVTLAAASAPCA